jgi:arginine N-succinyltransferase
MRAAVTMSHQRTNYGMDWGLCANLPQRALSFPNHLAQRCTQQEKGQSMWVVRPVVEDDINALVDLAGSLGSGMTTFPPDRATLRRKVELAIASFGGQLAPKHAAYLMALEDNESQQLLGVSAVYPSIGKPFGFFSYHVDRLVLHSPQLDRGLDSTILNLSNIYSGATEIGTLAVAPKARKLGVGKILARARYMLIATFPELFSRHVIAEMRGWQNEAGDSPFWSAVGERFFKMDFATADSISAIKGAEWIANLMPKFPIYLDLLPQDAQDAVGRAHATSAIAMAMLVQEGFRYENYVDVFDAGPQGVAEACKIKTITHSALASVSSSITDSALNQPKLVCNNQLSHFRLVCTDASIAATPPNLDANDLRNPAKLCLAQAARRVLNVSDGDIVRHVQF